RFLTAKILSRPVSAAKACGLSPSVLVGYLGGINQDLERRARIRAAIDRIRGIVSPTPAPDDPDKLIEGSSKVPSGSGATESTLRYQCFALRVRVPMPPPRRRGLFLQA